MLNWADKLIEEYTGGRQELKKRAEQIEEDAINKKHLFMSREETVILADILASFSLRERRCYILHVGQGMSWSKIAEELGAVRAWYSSPYAEPKRRLIIGLKKTL